MGFFGTGNDDGWNEARRNNAENRNLYEQIALPEYDEYVPGLYDAESYNHDEGGEDPMLKSKQMGNLNRLEQLANQGLSAEDEAGFAQARDIGAQQARSGTQAALANAEARGVAGGGMEFAMREMANQGGAQRSQAAGLEQAAAGARQRALQAQAYQSALGQNRDQDYRANSANTNIVNDFNSKNTQQRNSIGNANVDQKNSAFQYNQGLKDKKFNNQLNQADRRAGMNDRASQLELAKNDQDAKQRNADINQFMSVAQMGIGGMTAYGNQKRDEE
jgi:hypothetical protein